MRKVLLLRALWVQLMWLGLLLWPMTVSAEDFNIKISTLYPPGSEPVSSLRTLSKTLQTISNGQIRLKIYPGGVMGDDATVWRKIRVGQLQGALVSSSTLNQLPVELGELSKPFQFDSIADVYAMRQQTDEIFRERLKSKNWYGFGPLDGGFSYLMSKQPITSMVALKSTKLWLPNTEDIRRMSTALSVDYLVMNVSDVSTGLDTGAVDSLIAPPAAALMLNWHSRFNFFTQTPVLYTWGMLVLPEKTIQSIPEIYRVRVISAFTEWSNLLDSRLRTGNQKANEAISKLLKGLDFDKNDLETIRLSRALQ